MQRPYRLIYIIGFLILLRICAVWYGFDRLPLVTNTDEVCYNDPAVAMSRGYGLVGKSFAGTMKLEKFYALHPPVFMLLQAGIFRIFGLSVFTLRGSAIFSFIFCTILIVFLFSRLKRMGIYDDFAFFWITLLFLSEPSTLSCARWGRCDMLGIFFSLVAFILIVSKSGISTSRKRWLAGAGMIGLAISTHVAMVHFWLVYIIAGCFLFGRRNRKFCAILAVIPVFVFFGIWIAVYRENSLGAWMQFRQHVSYIKGYLTFFELAGFLLSGSLREFNQKGGMALILIVFSWIALMVGLWGQVRQKRLGISRYNAWVSMMAICAAGNLLIMELFTGSLITRAVIVLPIALAGLGLALTRLSLRGFYRYLLSAFLGLLVFAGLLGHLFYLSKIHSEWRARDCRRFRRLVASVPFDKKVATVPNLWYEFIKSGRDDIRIIYFDFAGDRDYWQENPQAFNAFDIIILNQDHPLLFSRAFSSRVGESFTIGGESFIVFRR